MRISDLSSDVCSTDLNLHAPRAEIAAAKIETETTDAEQRQVERQAVCLKLAGQIHPADVVEIGEAATAQTLGARLDVEQLDEIVGAEIDVVIEGFEDRHLLGLGQEQQPRQDGAGHAAPAVGIEIGRASCRERVCQYV